MLARKLAITLVFFCLMTLATADNATAQQWSTEQQEVISALEVAGISGWKVCGAMIPRSGYPSAQPRTPRIGGVSDRRESQRRFPCVCMFEN